MRGLVKLPQVVGNQFQQVIRAGLQVNRQNGFRIPRLFRHAQRSFGTGRGPLLVV
jgi:hypothetical protein